MSTTVAWAGFLWTLLVLLSNCIANGHVYDGNFSISSVAYPQPSQFDLLGYQPDYDGGTREYITRTGPRFPSVTTRRLLQEQPSVCGKVGTLVPNYYTSQASFYGVSISPNADGSLIVVGAPMNVPNVTYPGGAMLLTSQNSKTCEYTTRPVWKPKDSYKYFGAQVAMSEDGSTMLVMDGVEAVMQKQNVTVNGVTKVQSVPMGNKPVVHVFRQSKTPFIAPPDPFDPAWKKCCAQFQSDCCQTAVKKYGKIWVSSLVEGLPLADIANLGPGSGAAAAAAAGGGGAGGSALLNPASKKSSRQLLQGKEEFRYVQSLDAELRQAMASAMAVSSSKNGDIILVSMSVGEGFPDKLGSAQVFYLDKTALRYKFIQDLAQLNQPAGSSVHYGAASQISSDGQIIAVATASYANSLNKYTYMYKLDPATNRFRIISAINNGETYADPWPTASSMGVNVDNALAMSQTGKYVLRVEDNKLVVYEAAGSGMIMTWARRCQIAPPMGYMFRTNAGTLSIVEVAGGKVKFAAGSYVGDLMYSPGKMAVFMFYMDAAKKGSCPWRPAEMYTHADPFSQFGTAVALTADGKLLIVGAPEAWDNNMTNQTGAVYLYDASAVEDDGLQAKTVTLAANDKAGCVNGKDANGNDCVKKPLEFHICKDVKLKDGTVVHYGPPGCTPSPPSSGGWFSAASLGDAEPVDIPGVFKTSSVSAYTTLSPSIKGGVAVPVGQNMWLANQAKAASQASYFGVPTTAISNPKQSVVSAAGWPSSVSAALGGLPKPEPAPSGIKVASVLSGLGSAVAKGLLGAGAGGIGSAVPANIPGVSGRTTTSLGLPTGAVIRNPEVLQQGSTGG